MRRIMVANPKGGSGKSTLAVHLASWFCEERRASSVLGDLDRQRSTARWLAGRPRNLAPIRHWEIAGDEFDAPPEDCTMAILDTPAGLHGKRLKLALSEMDKIVVPVSPSRFDMLASRDFFEELAGTKAVRKDRWTSASSACGSIRARRLPPARRVPAAIRPPPDHLHTAVAALRSGGRNQGDAIRRHQSCRSRRIAATGKPAASLVGQPALNRPPSGCRQPDARHDQAPADKPRHSEPAPHRTALPVRPRSDPADWRRWMPACNAAQR